MTPTSPMKTKPFSIEKAWTIGAAGLVCIALAVAAVMYPRVLDDQSFRFSPASVRAVFLALELAVAALAAWLTLSAPKICWPGLSVLALAGGWLILCFWQFDPTLAALAACIAAALAATSFMRPQSLRWGLILFGGAEAVSVIASRLTGVQTLVSPGGVARPGGFLGNPILAGFILAIAALFAYREWELAESTASKTAAACLGALLLGGLALTFSRGPAYGVAIGSTALLFGKNRKSGLAFFVAALAAAVIVGGIRSHNAAGAASASLSASRRPYYWSYTLDVMTFTRGKGLGLHDADESLVVEGSKGGPPVSTTLSSLLEPVVQFGGIGVAWLASFVCLLGADAWSGFRRSGSSVGFAAAAVVLVCGFTYMVFLDRFSFAGTAALVFALPASSS